MKRGTLLKLRIVVPGTLGLLLLLSLGTSSYRILTLPEKALSTILVVAIGALYRIFDLRGRVVGFFWHDVDGNIKNRLLESLPSGAVTLAQASSLKSGRQLLDAFYKIIDNDPTLGSKMEGVYFNGLLATSAGDLTVFAFLGMVAHGVMGLLWDSQAHFAWAVGLLLIFAVGQFIMIPIVLKTHRRLSDEQLDVIVTHHRNEVRSLIEAALSKLSASGPSRTP